MKPTKSIPHDVYFIGDLERLVSDETTNADSKFLYVGMVNGEKIHTDSSQFGIFSLEYIYEKFSHKDFFKTSENNSKWYRRTSDKLKPKTENHTIVGYFRKKNDLENMRKRLEKIGSVVEVNSQTKINFLIQPKLIVASKD